MVEDRYAFHKPLLLSIFTFLSLLGIAQTGKINGYIIDSITKKPLLFATIVERETSTDSYLLGTTTKDDGSFSLAYDDTKGAYLETSFIGYYPKKIVIDSSMSSNPIVISLVLKPEMIAEIEIKGKTAISQNNSGDIIVNIEELGNIDNLSVTDIMATVPGLKIDMNGNIKGYDSQKYNILIGGKKVGSFLYTGNGSGLVLNNLPANRIKTIEVISEPNGRYGFNTPIINIIPKGDLKDVYYFNVEVGSNDKYQIKIEPNKTIKDFTISPSISYSSITKNEERSELKLDSALNILSSSRDIDSKKKTNTFTPSLSLNYSTNNFGSLSFTGEYEKSSYSIAKEYSMYSLDTINDDTKSSSNNYQLASNFQKMIKCKNKQIISIKLGVNYENDNDSDNQQEQSTNELNNYKSTSNATAGSGNINLNYSNSIRNINLTISSLNDYSYNKNISNRYELNSSTQTWDLIDNYSNNSTNNLINSSLTLMASKSIKTETGLNHFVRANITGVLRNEINKVDSTSKSTDYYIQEKLFYHHITKKHQRLTFTINSTLTPPSYNQLHKPLTYIDDYTLQKGNNALKSTLNVDGVLIMLKQQ